VRKSATSPAVTSGDIASNAGTAGRSGSPWRAVVGFGVVSLAADMVYQGARSVTGPLLASLGASAVLVGLVSGCCVDHSRSGGVVHPRPDPAEYGRPCRAPP